LGPVWREYDLGILNLNLLLLVQTEVIPEDLPVRFSIFNGEVFLRF
jgi:hypothetical protein